MKIIDNLSNDHVQFRVQFSFHSSRIPLYASELGLTVFHRIIIITSFHVQKANTTNTWSLSTINN